MFSRGRERVHWEQMGNLSPPNVPFLNSLKTSKTKLSDSIHRKKTDELNRFLNQLNLQSIRSLLNATIASKCSTHNSMLLFCKDTDALTFTACGPIYSRF